MTPIELFFFVFFLALLIIAVTIIAIYGLVGWLEARRFAKDLEKEYMLMVAETFLAKRSKEPKL